MFHKRTRLVTHKQNGVLFELEIIALLWIDLVGDGEGALGEEQLGDGTGHLLLVYLDFYLLLVQDVLLVDVFHQGCVQKHSLF
jgi:hypothetical protein